MPEKAPLLNEVSGLLRCYIPCRTSLRVSLDSLKD